MTRVGRRLRTRLLSRQPNSKADDVCGPTPGSRSASLDSPLRPKLANRRSLTGDPSIRPSGPASRPDTQTPCPACLPSYPPAPLAWQPRPPPTPIQRSFSSHTSGTKVGRGADGAPSWSLSWRDDVDRRMTLGAGFRYLMSSVARADEAGPTADPADGVLRADGHPAGPVPGRRAGWSRRRKRCRAWLGGHRGAAVADARDAAGPGHWSSRWGAPPTRTAHACSSTAWAGRGLRRRRWPGST